MLLRRTLGIFGHALAAVYVSAKDIYDKDPQFFEMVSACIKAASMTSLSSIQKRDSVRFDVDKRALDHGIDIQGVLFNAIIEILLLVLL